MSNYCMNLNLVLIFVNLIRFQSQIFFKKKINFMCSKVRTNLIFFINVMMILLLQVIFLLHFLTIFNLFKFIFYIKLYLNFILKL